MRSHAIACDRKQSHAISKKNLSFTNVQVLENASGTRSGTERLPKVFLHDNCEQISFIIFFAFLNKEEMRSGTHFTQQNVLLLFTVVVTKHVCLAVFSVPFPQNKFRTCFFQMVFSIFVMFLFRGEIKFCKNDLIQSEVGRRDYLLLTYSYSSNNHGPAISIVIENNVGSRQ